MTPTRENTYFPRGAALDLLRCKDTEIMLDGPAGTGKSRACLEKLNAVANKYPGCRLLMVRKTRKSLTETGLVTFEQHVRPNCDVFNSIRRVRQSYMYPNGSEIVIAGMDDPVKIMSAEFDLIYVQEATELDLNDWEFLTTRLRNGVVPYQQIFGDCNPGAPTHWLNQRMNAGITTRLLSRHEDNPRLFNGQGQMTAFGQQYMATLDKLTGPRHLRLRKGIWAAAEGVVYSDWDESIHVVTPFSIPTDWTRFRVVDFGFTHPFVCQWWAVDPDGRMYRYREIYRTKRLVEDHARDIQRLEQPGEVISATVCDHDAEDRATLERHLGCQTIPATKDISSGVQAVQERMKLQEDGRPRLFFFRDALVEVDPLLIDENTGLPHHPLCSEHEIEEYVWDERKDKPIKTKDHGMDATRYAVMHTLQDQIFDGISGYNPEDYV